MMFLNCEVCAVTKFKKNAILALLSIFETLRKIRLKNFLMVFNDVVLLSTFKRHVQHASKPIGVFFAKDAKKALDVLQQHPIDLLLTTFDLAETDGLELVAEVSVLYPSVKIGFFLHPKLTVDSEKLQKLSSFYFIVKPVSLKEFIHFISVGCLTIAELQALPVTEMWIGDFLQLIVYRQKTCALQVEHRQSGQKIVIYFQDGVLCDAVHEEVKVVTPQIGLEAYLSVDLNLVCEEFNSSSTMLEVLSWTQVKISFKTFDRKSIQQTLHVPLASFIAGEV